MLISRSSLLEKRETGKMVIKMTSFGLETKQEKKFELTNVETQILLKGHLLIWQGQMVRDK